MVMAAPAQRNHKRQKQYTRDSVALAHLKRHTPPKKHTCAAAAGWTRGTTTPHNVRLIWRLGCEQNRRLASNQESPRTSFFSSPHQQLSTKSHDRERRVCDAQICCVGNCRGTRILRVVDKKLGYFCACLILDWRKRGTVCVWR